MAWDDREHDEVLKALAVACEVSGTELSMPARKFMLDELQAHPARIVLAALRKCARSERGRLTLGAIEDAAQEVIAALPRKKTTYDICGQSEATVRLIFEHVPEPGRRWSYAWMERDFALICERSDLWDRYKAGTWPEGQPRLSSTTRMVLR